MKHIKISFFCAMMACFPMFLEAQPIVENGTDTLIIANETLVQVAYRKVAQKDLLAGVSTLNYQELTKKNYNTYSLDNLQGYVGGFNGSTLWGMGSYLVLVDGVPRDANNVLPTEIDQITFMKSGSALALYGSQAAKGVIYITTKRGKTGPLNVDVRANTGYNVVKSFPKYLGSAEYMTLYNEALVNDGLTRSYSDEDIYNHASGSNPYRYPNLNFFSSDYLKKAYNRSDVTVELSGGSERSRFYSNVGYYNQGDLFNFGEVKDNNVNRLNIRNNVDLNINDFISAHVNANATFYNSRNGNATDRDANDGITDDYWIYSTLLRPNRVSPLIPLSYLDSNDFVSSTLIGTSNNLVDGKYFLGGTQQDMTNVFADFYSAGYNKWTSRQFQFDTGLNFDLASILKGLTFNSLFAVDYNTSYTTSYTAKYATFMPSWYSYNGADVITGLTKYGNDEKNGVQNVSNGNGRQTIAFSGNLTYNARFNDVHNLTAILAAGGFQRTITGQYHKVNNANVGLQLAYNFKGKYYADFSAAEIHSSKLAEGKRNAFSPSLTLGWKLSEEDFLANSSVFDEVMLSASGSIINSDIDINGYNLYDANYATSGAWYGWRDGTAEQSINSKRGANPDLTFVKRKEIAANLKASLWKRLLTVDASFFVNKVEGLPIEPRASYPEYFVNGNTTSFNPTVNFNDDKRMGFDFNVNLNKKVGAVDFTLGVAGTYFKTEALKRDEVNDPLTPYRLRKGQAFDGIWGLKVAGFFKDDADINASPEQKFGGIMKPGDLKYIDQNSDNIIDEKDEVFLERNADFGDPFTMGVNFSMKWKNITLFALGTGHFGAYGMKNSAYYWVYGDRKYSEVVRGRWTEQTKETATYPRLTTQSGANNFRNSDFWLYKTDRFNLAKIQVTYDFPKSLFQNSFVDGISVYASGANLLTIAKESEILEMNIGRSPQTRFYNVGLKALF